MALQVAKSWSFEDAVEQWNRSERIRGTYRKIGKKNGSYVFRKSDELVPIIALAHDLGKIKTFKQKGDGTWYTAREDHDSLSAQMLMRIPEFWKLPRRERRITLLVVSTYHRDAELRRHVEHVGYEDRIFALLQLLIVADKAAGMLEEGKKSSEEQEVAEKDEEEDWRPKVWTAFTQLINQANRIAPKHNQYRIGQKSVVGKDKPMIILNEMSVRKELERMLPKECLRYAQTRGGGDVNGLTALLLETLDKHGVLVKQWGGFVTAPTSAIWQVEFHGRDKEKQGPIAKWKFSILVDPTEKFQNICEMPNADSVPRIEGPTGNRNEGLGFGEPGAESGISPDWEFEGEDDATCRMTRTKRQCHRQVPRMSEQGAASSPSRHSTTQCQRQRRRPSCRSMQPKEERNAQFLGARCFGKERRGREATPTSVMVRRRQWSTNLKIRCRQSPKNLRMCRSRRGEGCHLILSSTS